MNSNINPVNTKINEIQYSGEKEALKTDKGKDVSFEQTLKGFVKDVDQAQKFAGESVEKLLTGEIKDIHDVMIAVEKAGTSFELMMEIRNKMVDAYREVMRMQV